MIDLTLDSFLHPNLIGLQPEFGTVITPDAQNKGGLSTAQVDNNMGLAFALMRPKVISQTDTTSEVEYDAKLLITGDQEVTITLGNASYEGCKVMITNQSVQKCFITSSKIENVSQGKSEIAINKPVELIYTESYGWCYSNAVVGEIRICLTTELPAGNLYCDGSEYDVLDYPRLAPILLSLPFNVDVEEGKFRVPDLRNRFPQGANGNLGTTIEAGLPNITGQADNLYNIGRKATPGRTGAFSVKGIGNITIEDVYDNYGMGFDASKGESKTDGTLKTNDEYKVYGKSDTVQPPAFTVNYIIKY